MKEKSGDNFSSPKVSVIIPYFNDGAYISETIASVKAQTYKNIEIILVDDGSTEEDSIRAFDLIAEPDIKKYREKNAGPSAARNLGISYAAGKYILPLDADDIIDVTYIEKAVQYMEAHEDCGIVYCEAEFFGARSGKWELPPFTMRQMLHNNLIFVTALFRRVDWEKVGGYDTRMKYGVEDYDFWLSLLELGRKVYRLPEVLFFYRIKSVSRSTRFSDNAEKYMETYDYILHKHKKLYESCWLEELSEFRRQEILVEAKYEHFKQKLPFYNTIKNLGGEAEETAQAYTRHEIKHRTVIAIILTNVSGGGTPRHAFEIAAEWSRQGQGVIFVHTFQRLMKVFIYDRGTVVKVIRFWDEDGSRLVNLLKRCHVGLVHVEHLLDAEPWFLEIHRKLGVPLVVTLHDYYFACPFIRLTDENERYCGEESCNNCLARRKYYSWTTGQAVTDIDCWRNKWMKYLKDASLILVPSEDMKKRIQKYFPLDAVQLRENPELIYPKREYIHIGLIGTLPVAKGALMIKECLSLTADRHLPIRFTLFGTLNEVSLTKEEKQLITITGPYKEEEVYGQIREADIDFFWFPGTVPETYSYTLSIPIRLRLPCIAANIGAIGSRIRAHHWGETYPWDAEPGEVVQKLLHFDYRKYYNPDFVIDNTSFGTFEDFYSEVPYKQVEDISYETVNIPSAFDELPNILVREEFNELWKGASLQQKRKLLSHVDRKWLSTVWKEKGASYFFNKIKQKAFK